MLTGRILRNFPRRALYRYFASDGSPKKPPQLAPSTTENKITNLKDKISSFLRPKVEEPKAQTTAPKTTASQSTTTTTHTSKSPKLEPKIPKVEPKIPNVESEIPKVDPKTLTVDFKSAEAKTNFPKTDPKPTKFQGKSPKVEAKAPEVGGKSAGPPSNTTSTGSPCLFPTKFDDPPCPPKDPPCPPKDPPCPPKDPPCPPKEPPCPPKEPPCPPKEPPCPPKEPPCPPKEPPKDPPCPPKEPCPRQVPPCPPKEPSCPRSAPTCPPKVPLCPRDPPCEPKASKEEQNAACPPQPYTAKGSPLNKMDETPCPPYALSKVTTETFQEWKECMDKKENEPEDENVCIMKEKLEEKVPVVSPKIVCTVAQPHIDEIPRRPLKFTCPKEERVWKMPTEVCHPKKIRVEPDCPPCPEIVKLENLHQPCDTDPEELLTPKEKLKERQCFKCSTIQENVWLDQSPVTGVPQEMLKERTAVIYKSFKNVMQQGTEDTNVWEVQWNTKERWKNPLMGWASTADPMSNIKLQFSSQLEAERWCTRNGWKYQILPERDPAPVPPKSYSNNFSWNRRFRVSTK